MPNIAPQKLNTFTADVLRAAGATEDEIDIVAPHLVDACLAGHDSHGVLRLLQYVQEIRDGVIVPGTDPITLDDWETGRLIDATGVFGQVACHQAMQTAIHKAREHSMAMVVLRGANHSGRLGAWVELAAAENMIGLVMVNGGGSGQWVAPFGGRRRRLGTNPIAIGAPSETGCPIVLDMGTSIVPEGKIRHQFQKGEQVPDGWLIDHEGIPTNDPRKFYSDPPGAILPLGGPAGHKGYALAFLVDLMAGALSGAGCCRPGGNDTIARGGIIMMAIDIARFTTHDAFHMQVSRLVDYMKVCPPAPGFEEVLVPGELEFKQRQHRMRHGIDVADPVWEDLNALLDGLRNSG